MRMLRAGLMAASAMLTVTVPASAQDRPWLNSSLGPDERASLAIHQMTQDEKLTLVYG
jgi:beta-glucosidase